MNWQLQQARNRLSQVVQEAGTDAPQVITVHGAETAVVLSAQDYRRLIGRTDSLIQFLRQSPWAGTELVIERDQGVGRDIEL